MVKAEKHTTYEITEKVFLYPSDAASWHFVPVTKSIGQAIKAKYGKLAKGFGSLPVVVTLRQTTWTTSIFPDKYSGSYILPLKAKIRKKEDIEAGDKITFSITIAV